MIAWFNQPVLPLLLTRKQTDMIDNALKFVAADVNKYLFRKIASQDPTMKFVVLGNVARAQDPEPGNNNNTLQGKAVLTLVNIEEDRISKPVDRAVRYPDRIEYRNPKIYLNLYCLFSVVHNSYDTALQYLSLVIQYFQHKPFINHQNSPSSAEARLDSRIEGLVFDMVTMNFEQVNHLWGTLGGKYLPSVLYKVRLVALEDDTPGLEGPPITDITINENTLSQS